MNFKSGRFFPTWFLIFFVALLANFGTCLQDTRNLKKSEEKAYPYPNVILPFIPRNRGDEGPAANLRQRERESEGTEKDVQPRASSSDNSNAKYYYIGGGVLIILIILGIVTWCCCRSKKDSKEKALKKALKDSKGPKTAATLHPVPPHSEPMEMKVDLNPNSPPPIPDNPFTSPTESDTSVMHQAEVHVEVPLEVPRRVQQWPYEDNSREEFEDFSNKNKTSKSSSESSSGKSGDVTDEEDPTTSRLPYIGGFYNFEEKENNSISAETSQKIEMKEELHDSKHSKYEKSVEKSVVPIYNSDNKVDSVEKSGGQFTSTVITDHNPTHSFYVTDELKETDKSVVMQKSIHEKENSFERSSDQFASTIATNHNHTRSTYASDELKETDKGPTVMPKPKNQSNIQKIDSFEKHDGYKNVDAKYYPYRLEHMSSKPDVQPKPIYRKDDYVDSQAADSINNPGAALEPFVPKPIDGDIKKIADKHKMFAVYADLKRKASLERDSQHKTDLEGIEAAMNIPREYEPSRRHVHRRYSLESLHERELYNRSYIERDNDPKIDPYVQSQREKFSSLEREPYNQSSNERYIYPDKRVHDLPRQERYVSPNSEPYIHSRNERYRYSEMSQENRSQKEKYGSLEREPYISQNNRSPQKYGSLEREPHMRQGHRSQEKYGSPEREPYMRQVHSSQKEKYGSLEREPYTHSRNERYNNPEMSQDNLRSQRYNSPERNNHNQLQKHRYNSFENESNINSQKLRRYSSDKDSYSQPSRYNQSQTRYDYPYDPPLKHKQNFENIPHDRSQPQTQKSRYQEKDSYDQDLRHKHSYSERNPHEHPQKIRHDYERELFDRPQKPGYHLEKNSLDRPQERQEKIIVSHPRNVSPEIKNYNKTDQLYEKGKYDDDRHKTEAHKRNISDKKIKPKDITIPEPDYLTRGRKDLEQFKSSLQEKLDSRPPVPPKPEAKSGKPESKSRGDFKRPYGLEDLDDLNNPLTIAIRSKPQRPSPYSYTNPE